MSRNHIPSLDGIRALSIGIVFAAHAGVSKLFPGGFGVTVFFFLSGYLITTLLCREYDRHGSIAFRAFYLRRVLRLGPPLLATLALGTALVLLGLADGELSLGAYVSQILFVYNYFHLLAPDETTISGLDVLWSLAIEEHFYFLWPALFLLFARGRIRVPHLTLLLLAVLIWRLVRFYVLGNSAVSIYSSTDTRIDSLLYGCLLALLAADGRADRMFGPGRAVTLIWIAVAIGVLLPTFVLRGDGFRETFRYTIQGLALMPLFHYAVTQADRPLFRWLNGRIIRRIGLYSYTLYLVHQVVIYALARNGLPPFGSLPNTLLALALSLGWAALVNEALEKPFVRLRAAMTGHPGAKTPPGKTMSQEPRRV